MAEISKQALQVANNTDFPNNNTGYITPAILRSFNTDMIDSTVNQAEYTTNSGSWNRSISALNTFTASQQPSFTALNAFTASQLTINSGYNSATQSLSASIAPLQPQITSLQNWTASVNAIYDDGTLQGYSTRLSFYGLVSASIVPNVNGAIASINILQDSTKANTGSLNNVTSSINQLNDFSASALNSILLINTATASLNLFSASINQYTASTNNTINQYSASFFNLNAFSASALNSISSLNAATASIATKLNTSSFNDYTASINSYTASNNTKWTTIGLLTGSYATTGSNSFTGSQTITGSVLGNIVPLTITSQTASMDLSKGNFFTLTLVSGSSTLLTASNIKAGQTINLLVTQASVSSGTLTYTSTFKFTPGNAYTASVSSSTKDIITFITFDNSTIYASAIKNLV